MPQDKSNIFCGVLCFITLVLVAVILWRVEVCACKKTEKYGNMSNNNCPACCNELKDCVNTCITSPDPNCWQSCPKCPNCNCQF